jgi:hypothetical protein
VDRAITVLGRPQGSGLTTGAGACGVSGRTIEQLRTSAHAVVADTRSLPGALVYSGAALLAVGALLRLM